jgi:glycosyltransferase involved in cell wall biosynthesis
MEEASALIGLVRLADRDYDWSMKILHVETGRHLYGGPQQVIYLMQALAERGHEGELICPPASGIDNAARAAQLPVRNLFCAGDLDLPFAYRLTQYINETRPDIVHCHSRRGADILGGLAASFADVPAVVSRRVDNTELRLLAALRYRPFIKVIAISEAVAAALRNRGIEDERIEVIRSAVDAEAFADPPDCGAMREEFHVPDDCFVMAAVGQLIERKGHRYLLEAAATLKSRETPFRLIIFGEGPLETDLRAQAASLGLGDIVQFAGFRAELDTYFGCLDLVVHPSLAEGLGVATLKAQAAGVAVVGFNAGGLPEAVASDESGLLVAPGDTAALTEAIARLMNDGSLRKRMGAAGRERMRTGFSIDSMADRHVELYESIL